MLFRSVGALETGERGPAIDSVLGTLEATNDVFPDLIPSLRTALALTGPIAP